MDKIKSQKDIDKLLDDAILKNAVTQSSLNYHSLEVFDVQDFEEFFASGNEKIFSSADIKLLNLLEIFDFLYIMGYHASSKGRFARNIAGYFRKKHRVFLYDWIEFRNYVSRYGRVPDDSLFYKKLRNRIEQELLEYGKDMLSYGGKTIIAESGLSHHERARMMDQLPTEGGHVGVALVLVSPLRKLLQRNAITNSYIESSRRYDDYYASNNLIFPNFDEGFKRIIVINETNENDMDYISSANLIAKYQKLLEAEYIDFRYHNLK